MSGALAAVDVQGLAGHKGSGLQISNPSMMSVLASMPLRVWRTDEVTPLAPHPNVLAAVSSERG
jgi:hypothetical protein